MAAILAAGPFLATLALANHAAAFVPAGRPQPPSIAQRCALPPPPVEPPAPLTRRQRRKLSARMNRLADKQARRILKSSVW